METENKAPETPAAAPGEQAKQPLPASLGGKPEGEETAKGGSFIMENKGLLVAILVAVIVIIIGVSAVLDFGSADQYQGLIQQVETQTAELQGE